MPRTASPRRALALLAAALAGSSCATAWHAPRPGVAEHARAVRSYSGSLRVTLSGPLRARSAALVAFRRPEAMRIEVPGAAGARLVAVANQGRLVAVFPGERAFYQDDATPEAMERLFGVALGPGEVMQLLVGERPSRALAYRASWGEAGDGPLPTRIEADLRGGARLTLRVDEADGDVELPDAAFDPPPHAGLREIDAAEARSLWRR